MYLEEKVPLTLTTTEVAITFSAAGRAADNHKYQKLFEDKCRFGFCCALNHHQKDAR